MDWYKKVDRIFIVNLLERKDRREEIVSELKQYDIPARVWLASIACTGEIGLVKTMKNLFEHSLYWNFNKIIVFEDDNTFIAHPEVVDKCFEQLPEDFHMLYFGLNLINAPELYSENLLKVNMAYASHAVLYSKEAMELILPHLKKEDRAYDVILKQEIQPLGKSYCTYPMVCSQRLTKSDIFKYDPSVHLGLEKFFDVQSRNVDMGRMMEDKFEMFTKNL